jgi:predicted RNase H-like HicB family nuclease
MERIKIVVEHHPDGFVAYPLGVRGVVVGQGDTAEEAIADVTSAIRFHVETFGKEVLDAGTPVLDAFVTDAALAPS